MMASIFKYKKEYKINGIPVGDKLRQGEKTKWISLSPVKNHNMNSHVRKLKLDYVTGLFHLFISSWWYGFRTMNTSCPKSVFELFAQRKSSFPPGESLTGSSSPWRRPRLPVCPLLLRSWMGSELQWCQNWAEAELWIMWKLPENPSLSLIASV